MEARLLSESLYNVLFTTGQHNDGIVPYSCVPLEIEYIERLRKDPSMQISQLRSFCENLNVTRIPLTSVDVAQAIDDEESREAFFNSRANPYHMAAMMALTFQPWWDCSLLQQFQEIYG